MNHLNERRAKLHATLRWFFSLPNIHIGNEMPEEAVIVCTQVEHFDVSSNDVWTIAANKSYPRDVQCGCGKQVVMSDGMYKRYIEGGRKNKIICTRELLKMKT